MKSTQSLLQGRSPTRLAFEQLEPRRMLAQYGFDVNLYEDAGGAAGGLIAADTVEVGDVFFVEITAEDLRDDPRGLQSMGVHVGWDPEVLQFDGPFDPSAPASPLVTASFPLYRSGKLDQTDGVIYNLRGVAMPALGSGSPIGIDGPERFALLRFRALEAAEDSPLVVQASGSVGFIPMPIYIAPDDLRFEAQTITVVAPTEPTLVDFTSMSDPADVVGPSSPQEPSSPDNSTAGVGLVDGRHGDPGQVLIEPQSITVQQEADPPIIAVGTSLGPGAEAVQFTTAMVGADGGAQLSPLVRPAFPDTKQFVEVANPGTSPLVIHEIQIDAPGVAVDPALTADPADDVVLPAGQTRRFRLAYAPSTPNPQDASAESFCLADGLVILSNAENAPRVEVALCGESTFNGDLTYDGTVNLADLAPFDEQFGLQAGDAGFHATGDPNGDGSVDLGDFAAFIAHYRHTRPAPPPAILTASTVAKAKAADAVFAAAVEEEPPEVLAADQEEGVLAAVAAGWFDADEEEDGGHWGIPGPSHVDPAAAWLPKMP